MYGGGANWGVHPAGGWGCVGDVGEGGGEGVVGGFLGSPPPVGVFWLCAPLGKPPAPPLCLGGGPRCVLLCLIFSTVQSI